MRNLGWARPGQAARRRIGRFGVHGLLALWVRKARQFRSVSVADLLIAALGAAALGAATCGPFAPGGLRAPTPTPHVHGPSNATWRVSPSIEEQVFRSDVIVRATLQSATAAVETRPGDPGVAPTYLAVQELRFTVHEYLKGSGPTDLLVVVRGRHANPVEAEAREYADYQVGARVTTWDARQAVLFLEAPSSPYTPAAGGGEAAGSSESTAPAILAFTRSNYGQPPWAYSVDTLRPAWLPAENMPAEGQAPTAFITDGTPDAATHDHAGSTYGPGSRRWRRSCRPGQALRDSLIASLLRINSVNGIVAPTLGRRFRNPRRWPPGQRPGLT